MNSLKILTSSFHLLFRNAGNVALLCLPLMLVEMFIRNIIRSKFGIETSWGWQALIGTVIPPFYTGLLILALDARTRGARLIHVHVLSKVLRLWPALAVLSALDQLLIVIANLSFISADTWLTLTLSTLKYFPPHVWTAFRLIVFLVAMWVMMRLMFNQCLMLLRGLPTGVAIRESIIMSKGQLWRVVACFAWVLAPVLLITGIATALWPEWMVNTFFGIDMGNPVRTTLYTIYAGFTRVFTTIVVFRFFTLISERVSAE